MEPGIAHFGGLVVNQLLAANTTHGFLCLVRQALEDRRRF